MNQNIITKLNLETRTRDLKQQGKSEREISRTLSEETRQNVSKSAVHRLLVKAIEPQTVTIEPPQTHQSIEEPEPQRIDTPISMFRESVLKYMNMWEKEHASINISNYLYFCDDCYHYFRSQKFNYSNIKIVVCDIKRLSPKVRKLTFKQPDEFSDYGRNPSFTFWQ